MIKKIFLAAILFISTVAGVFAADATNTNGDTPLLTFGCFSDIHSQQNMINTDLENVYIRTAFTNALNSLKKHEDVDLIVLGGDYTSDVTITEEKWRKVRTLMDNATKSAFRVGKEKHPVLYVNGNHEYEVANFDALPKLWNAGDYYTTPMRTEIGELSANDCFYELADNGTSQKMNLLAAYHYVINGFDFVVLNTGKYFFASAWDYQYSEESVAWVDAKLDEIYKDNPNKTVFFLAHLPFSDSNGVQASKGMKATAATTLLKTALAKHPNLVFLYGHDHSSNQVESYIKTSTSQRVTQYDTDGNVYTAPVVPEETTVTDFYIQSVASNNYLGFDTYNLNTIAATNKFTVANSIFAPGTVTLFGENAPTDNNGYIHCGSSGRFSGNKTASANSSIYLYEVIQKNGSYEGTLAAWPESGKTYAIVTLSTAGGYYALSNAVYSVGTTGQRMTGVSSSNQTTITFADNTVLWKFIDAAPAPIEPENVKAYYIQTQDGQYLDFSDNLSVVSAATGSQGFKFTASTVTTAPYAGTSSVHALCNSASQYIHCGSNGNFSANATIGDTNTGTSIWLYKVVDGTNAVKVSESNIVSGQNYLIVGLKNGTYYQLLNTNNGATGNTLRMLGENIGTTLLESITYNGNTNALWTITEKPEEGGATPSFISSFMGSMRYNSLETNSSPNLNNSPIIQSLVVYVYDDRVVLSMKNYGETGLLSGAAVTTTINNSLASYVSKREVSSSPTTFLENMKICQPFACVAQGMLSVRNLKDGSRVVIYDTMGRMLVNTVVRNNSFNYSTIEKGVYLVRVSTDKEDVVLKVIK